MKPRGGVLRLADRQPDRFEVRRRLDTGEEAAQFFRRIALQAGEVGIHGYAGSLAGNGRGRQYLRMAAAPVGATARIRAGTACAATMPESAA